MPATDGKKVAASSCSIAATRKHHGCGNWCWSGWSAISSVVEPLLQTTGQADSCVKGGVGMKLVRMFLALAVLAGLTSVAYVSQLNESSGSRMVTAADKFVG